MKILFVKHLRGKGSIGDIKEVPDGYGMNFLIAQGYAVKATDEVIKKYQQIKEMKEIEDKKEFEEISTTIKSLNNKQVTIQVSRKDLSGKLYKSISITEIIQEIRRQLNIQVNSDWVDYPKPIKETGKHSIKIKYRTIHSEISVLVN